MSLEIPESICRQIISHCRACLPHEGCGILAGRDGRAAVFYPVGNIDRSSAHFFMDPEEQLHVMRAMREAGLSMLGICHSHPDSPAYPSEKDIRLAVYDETAYLVVSFADQEPHIEAFSIVGGAVTPVVVKRV